MLFSIKSRVAAKIAEKKAAVQQRVQSVVAMISRVFRIVRLVFVTALLVIIALSGLTIYSAIYPPTRQPQAGAGATAFTGAPSPGMQSSTVQSSGNGGPVFVHSYTRANGTHVESYTRSAPSHSGGHGGHR